MTIHQPSDGQQDPEPVRAGNYILDGRGITWLKPGGNGPTEVPLANFGALIISDTRIDDGSGETRRAYEIGARLNGRGSRFIVPADRFSSMNWPAEHLGASAIVRPGMGLRDHTRVAIQELSGVCEGGIPERHVYAHTGWRELPGGWGYLTASGAVMASGLDESVTVDLGPALSGYELPAVSDDGALCEAITVSLAILNLAPDAVTVPLLGAVYRAALPLPPDCAVWLYGQSGTLKTSISAVAQQHFGAGLDAYALPGNWTSTANMLEMQAFTLANAVLTVDDYSPDVSVMEARKRAATADRLLRGSTNHAARGRLNSDASMRQVKPPRAQIVTSAEDLPPAGASLRARILVSEVARGAVALGPLAQAQEAGDSGQLALAMSGYVQRLAGQFPALRGSLKPRLAELRDTARAGGHVRVALNIASLALGWEQFLSYAVASGALDNGQAPQLFNRTWKALADLGADQNRYQRDASPADAYLHALAALITSGRAHLAGPSGGQPAEPQRCGWKFSERALDGTWVGDRHGVWQTQGDLIGWTAEEGVFLDPDVAYRAARQFAESAGQPLGVSKYALHQQLRDRRLLASTGSHTRIPVQRRIGGRVRNVLHLSTDALDGGAE